MAKEGFIIYKSYYEPIKYLSDEQLGKLFRAIFEYQINGVIEVDPEIKMAFEFFRNQFRLDADKYNKIVERNKQNGLRGGRPSITQENPNNPVGILKPKKADKEKDKEKEKEKDKEKGKDIYMSPTLAQIISFSKELGYGDESYCKRFFNHYESVGWKTTNGALIENWKPKFEEWLEKDKVVKNGGDETREVIRPGSPGKRRIL